MTFGQFLGKLARKKIYSDSSEAAKDTRLLRCLTTLDLIALGVGSTLGAGVYVLTGSVARDKTGPAVVLSFLVAAVASAMAGLCYAEFGARVPKAGSAYVYSYVTVGEFWAFVIGWNLVLEYVIGGRFKAFSLRYLKMDVPGLAQYPDLFAFGIILVLTVVLCFGVKESANFSKLFTLVNIVIILFVIVAGGIYSNVNYWYLSVDDIEEYYKLECQNILANGSITSGSNTSILSEDPNPTISEGHVLGDDKGMNCTPNSEGKYDVEERFGHGGYFPYGFSGVMSGAATCFFGFIGFDVIATTGEEVKNPQRSIPLSIVISLVIVFFAYVGISSVLTLIIPYYMLDIGAPLPRAFEHLGLNWAVIPLAIGATCALSSSLLGSLFPLPRVVYAMSQDGLIFKFLARINKRFKTPLIATLLSGQLAAIMVLLFDLEDLVDMMSIGTLLAYTLVAICVLILRYQPATTVTRSRKLVSEITKPIHTSVIHNMRYPPKEPTEYSGNMVYCCTITIGSLSFVLCALLVNIGRLYHILVIVCCSILMFLIGLCTLIIFRQPQSKEKLGFKVPLVPILPVVSSICNIYLMCELSIGTWIRFAAWMTVGFMIYFGYGMRNSTARSGASTKYVSTDSEQVVMLQE